MSDYLLCKLKELKRQYTTVFENGIPKHFFPKQIKSDPYIYCYHYQIPDIILYKDENFKRKDCYFITSNLKKANKKASQSENLTLKNKHEMYINLMKFNFLKIIF